MRLVTFQDFRENQDLRENRHSPRLGALVNEDLEVVDLHAVDAQIPADMLGLLAGGDALMERARQAVADAAPAQRIGAGLVKLLAPVPRPGKIICIGLNYRDHAAETGQAVPDYPTVFAKYANVVVGPEDPIVLPEVTEEIDYEAELAFVIGRQAKGVPQEEALRYVAGYVPFNDVSAREYQRRTSQWTVGKTFDTFGPMGPALVTADEIGDPHTLDIRLSIDGEVLQSSNTRHLIFRVEDLIAYLSAVMTLEPGDLISTGTPSGVGAARSPKRWLRDGERVRIEIDRLGVLENPVVSV